jgi:nucleotide-binding universal stress UspA family protein
MSEPLLEHILVPIDGSPSALLAARCAASICVPGGSLGLLQVTTGVRDLAAYGIDTFAGLAGGVSGDLHDQVRIAEDTEATRLLEEAKAALPSSVRVQTATRQGQPAAVILDELGKPAFDSVVLGSRGRGAIARAFFGSVADRVARQATKAVFVARNAGVHRILVGVDGSEPALRAVQAAAVLARRLGAGIDLLHVVNVPPASRQSADAAVRAAAEGVLKAAVTAIGAWDGLEVGTAIDFAEPVQGLLGMATGLGADVLVVGRCGRSLDPRSPLGSVAQRIATHADASVWLIP